jgi:hypothetical protein
MVETGRHVATRLSNEACALLSRCCIAVSHTPLQFYLRLYNSGVHYMAPRPHAALTELSCGSRTNYIIIYYSSLYMLYVENRFTALKNVMGFVLGSLLISSVYITALKECSE